MLAEWSIMANIVAIMEMNMINRRDFIKLAGLTAGSAGLGVLNGCECSECKMMESLEHPSVNMMVGQMVMAGFRGLVIEDSNPIVEDIVERHLGGVILFDKDVPMNLKVRNISSSYQLKRMIDELQSYAFIPLLIAIDQEGGRVARLNSKRDFPKTKSHSELGKGTPEATYEHAKIIANMLSEAGININMAPVVDLCANPDNPVIARLGRCFSDDPEIVAKHAMAYIKAHHEFDIRCCLKHFPGHGSSSADSHLGLVDVTKTWTSEELVPYQRIVKAKMADAVMTAHVFNANIDKRFPATLSSNAVTDLLRGGIGFNGVVFSDDMQMGAITQHYGFETAIERAVLAGVDVMIFANNSYYDKNIVKKATAVIKRMLDEELITVERLRASYDRIVKLKLPLT